MISLGHLIKIYCNEAWSTQGLTELPEDYMKLILYVEMSGKKTPTE